MPDAELRGKLLKVFYDRRHNANGWVPTSDIDTSGGEFVDRQVIGGICSQLAEVGLIEWKPLIGGIEGFVIGMAKITATGVDVIDGARPSPIAININPALPVPTASPRSLRAKEVPHIPRRFDCFVSYAGEDRSMVKQLVAALEAREIHVWWDRGQITLGDRLSEKIDEGLGRSRYGLVIVSKFFVAKKWTEAELRSLLDRAISSGQKVILPVLVNINHDSFAATYPLLRDIVSTTFDGNIDTLVTEIIQAIRVSAGKGDTPMSAQG
jgi:hypothetical protein